ncbi:MAG: phospholipid carrier-dependent glycosyltransferase [Anaerolineae bacterium]|nr:phospholipid carrier-dependent glycosyltransferase [Anaerolineae bacterium]
MSKVYRTGLPLLFILAYFTLGMAQATHASITFDEGPHLAIGYATLRTGDLRLQPVHIHPPLANVLAAAPLLLQSDLPDPRAVDGWEIASLSAITDAVVWRYPEPARITVAGRVPILWLGVLLGALICRWTKDLGGWRAGLLALTLYAFDPNCIAHGALITTDMAAVFFIAATLYLTNCELRITNYTSRIMYSRSLARLVAIGVLLGLAQLAKVSALMLVPVLGLLLVQAVVKKNQRITSHEPRITNHKLRTTYHISRIAHQVLRAWAIVFGVAAFVVWAGYGFEISAVPGVPFPLPAGTHLRIFQSLQEHYDLGHPTFLMGRVSDHGWWWYFPVAFVLKTPLPVLVLVVGMVVRCGLRVKSYKLQVQGFELSVASLTHHLSRITSHISRQTANVLALLLFPLLYAVSSLFSSVNIGYRHLLPLLPFLYVGIGVWSMEYGVWSRKRGSRIANDAPRITHHASRITYHPLLRTPYFLLVTLCFLLLAWLVIGTVSLTPNFLTFFNAIAGGARGGYRYLVDSNLDWGQNLWDLRAWMDQHSEDHVYYAHYSPARLDVYGIDATYLPPDPRAGDFAPWNPTPGLYAIGATVLQGPYGPDVNTYAWFRGREPEVRLGNALWLYRVLPREEPGWAVLCADIPFSPETLEQQTGVADLRMLWPDCARTFVYPAGTQPGVIVIKPDEVVLPTADVDVSLRSSAGETEYVVYRLSGLSPTPETEMSEIVVNGPLNFLGYTLDADDVSPGNEIVLQTYWRVREVPGRPLSLLAHLLGPDGTGVEVGDGLGFPIEQWRPGDVIVQQHVLSIPAGAPPGEYTVITGAYWLDTMERWSVGARETHIVVEAIVVGD